MARHGGNIVSAASMHRTGNNPVLNDSLLSLAQPPLLAPLRPHPLAPLPLALPRQLAANRQLLNRRTRPVNLCAHLRAVKASCTLHVGVITRAGPIHPLRPSLPRSRLPPTRPRKLMMPPSISSAPLRLKPPRRWNSVESASHTPACSSFVLGSTNKSRLSC